MLTSEQMALLKKVNISRDAEKTKSRIAEDFKSTSNENKKAIENLAGLKRNTFYRVFDTGNATAKVVLSMAQVLNVTPFYYTGVEDEKGECSDEVLEMFLKEHGYDDIKPKRKYNRRLKVEADAQSEMPLYTGKVLNEDVEIIKEPAKAPETVESVKDAVSETVCNDMIEFSITLNSSGKMSEAVNSLDEETAAMLLKSLMKRAEAGGNAEMLCDIVKRCLLS